MAARPIIVLIMLTALLMTLCAIPVHAQLERVAQKPFALNSDERAWLEKHKELRVGMWLGSPPGMFRGESGVMEGMIPTYMNIVIDKLQLKPKRVRASGFAAMWELVKAGEVDVIAAVTAAPEREDHMLLSEPYLYMPIIVATRTDFRFIAGLNDLEEHVVAMTKNHIPHVRIPNDYPGIIIHPVESAEEGLMSVTSGRADAFVGDQATVAYLSHKHGVTDIRVAAITEYSYKLSVGIRKDWPELRVMVNRALASISEKERKGIRDYWTVFREGGWVERPYVLRVVGSVVVVAVVLLGVIVYWNRKLAMEINRRRLAEAKLRKANEETQEVIESANVIIIGLDYMGRILMLNSACEEILGYSRDELMGKDWFDVIAPRERYPFVWEEFSQIVNSGAVSKRETFENPVLTKSGDIKTILWRNSRIEKRHDGVALISFGTDITHRLKREEELRLTQFAMDNAAVGVFRISPSGQIVYANRTAANMLGFTRTELRSKTVPEVSPDYAVGEWSEFWDYLKKRQMIVTEKSVLKRSGKVMPIEVTAYHITFKGTEHAIGFFSDISERKRVDMLRDDVERMVRHDLRSPIIAVQALLKLFGRAENLTDSQQELLSSVNHSSRRMINIIDMSRALHKMEEGVFELRPKPVNILDVLEAVLEDIGSLLRVKSIKVDITICGVPPGEDETLVFMSEEVLIDALLANLVRNAVEASPENSMVQLEMCVRDQLVVRIHNEGAIPDAIRDSFFEKYVTSGKEHGTGLGTYTAHLIVTSLGGDIDFISTVSKGTTINIRLPG